LFLDGFGFVSGRTSSTRWFVDEEDEDELLALRRRNDDDDGRRQLVGRWRCFLRAAEVADLASAVRTENIVSREILFVDGK
jgi:hypothetical protein